MASRMLAISCWLLAVGNGGLFGFWGGFSRLEMVRKVIHWCLFEFQGIRLFPINSGCWLLAVSHWQSRFVWNLGWLSLGSWSCFHLVIGGVFTWLLGVFSLGILRWLSLGHWALSFGPWGVFIWNFGEMGRLGNPPTPRLRRVKWFLGSAFMWLGWLMGSGSLRNGVFHLCLQKGVGILGLGYGLKAFGARVLRLKGEKFIAVFAAQWAGSCGTVSAICGGDGLSYSKAFIRFVCAANEHW